MLLRGGSYEFTVLPVPLRLLQSKFAWISTRRASYRADVVSSFVCQVLNREARAWHCAALQLLMHTLRLAAESLLATTPRAKEQLKSRFQTSTPQTFGISHCKSEFWAGKSWRRHGQNVQLLQKQDAREACLAHGPLSRRNRFGRESRVEFAALPALPFLSGRKSVSHDLNFPAFPETEVECKPCRRAQAGRGSDGSRTLEELHSPARESKLLILHSRLVVSMDNEACQIVSTCILFRHQQELCTRRKGPTILCSLEVLLVQADPKTHAGERPRALDLPSVTAAFAVLEARMKQPFFLCN